jgi:CheY-like chemotaxis protein
MNFTDTQKVLVADDDIVNRQVLAELLKPEHTVLLAKKRRASTGACRAAPAGPDSAGRGDA